MGKTHTEILNEIHAMREPELKVPKGIADRKRVVSLIKEIQVVLLPGYFNYNNLSVEAAFDCVVKDLDEQAGTALCFSGTSPLKAKELTQKFLESLPEILRQINTDIQAIYDGDPAAKTKSEVIICYPGFYAISIYRIAHIMYKLGIPYLPRIMTEYAHEKTGIDINPGATIGDYFCIDHGTGIVIGETAVLGHHVKLYQGVTIGAKSFEKDENGNPVKGGKRHPDIGNNVVIYANATILGGDTYIGDNSVIGGNTWIIDSVEEGKKVYYKGK
jgi:serine O-acetyltransferase